MAEELNPKSDQPSRVETVAPSSLSDQATADDKLGFKPYVEAIAAFLTHIDTKPPLTISIEGSWGSGKSSFMKQLENEIGRCLTLQKKKTKAVWFNAWRHDKAEALWAAFALNFVEKLAAKLPIWKRIVCHARLQFRRFNWKAGWVNVLQFAALSAFFATVSISALLFLHKHPEAFTTLYTAEDGKPAKPEEMLLRFLLVSTGGAGYIIASFLLFRKLVEVLGNPLRVELKKFIDDPGYGGRVEFVETFHSDFGRIVESYSEGETVFVFVDDLDRTDVPTSAGLMQAFNLLISDSPRIVYVLGLDRERVAAGLAAKYEKVIPYLSDGQSSAVGIEFGFSYLEKFIQLPFQVPQPAQKNVRELLEHLNSAVPNEPYEEPQASAVDPGILFETRVDSPLVKSIVQLVAPCFDNNPRAIKRFINCFRLHAVIASQTGAFGPPRVDAQFHRLTAEQLGKLVAIALRWPLLLADSAAMPGLLGSLQELAFSSDALSDSDPKTQYWFSKRKLMQLLAAPLGVGAAKRLDLDFSKYSLWWVDLDLFLRVSPRTVPNRAHEPGRPDRGADRTSQEGPGTAEARNSSVDDEEGRSSREYDAR